MDEDRKKILDDILNGIDSESPKSEEVGLSLDDILAEYKGKKEKEPIITQEVKEEAPLPELPEIKEPIKESTSLKDNIEKWIHNEPVAPKKEELNTKLDSFFTQYYEDKEEEIEPATETKVEEITQEEQTEEIETEEDEPKKSGGFFQKLFSEDETDEEPIFDAQKTEQEEIDEYDEPDDAASIKADLLGQKKEALFKTVICGIITALLLYIDFGAQFNSFLPSFLSPISSPISFGFASAVLTMFLIMSGIKTFFYGLKNLFTFKATNDSLPAFAVLTSLAHSIFILLGSSKVEGNLFLAYSGLAALSFFFTLLGKYIQIKSVSGNFDVVSSEKPKLSLVGLASSEIPAGIEYNANECGAVVQTKFISGFLERSFSDNPSEEISKKITPFIFVAIIIVTALSLIKGNLGEIPAKMASISAVCASFMAELSFALPFFLETKKSRKNGGAITGYTTAKRFSNISCLATKDAEIIPPSETSINGIKGLNDIEISNTIMKIASLYNELGGPVSKAFLKTLDNKQELLKSVSDVKIFEGQGISGVIEGSKIYAGNAEFMKSCGIKLPTEDYEAKFARGGKSVILFAENGVMSGVFIISYGFTSSALSAVKRLDEEGIELLVYTDDYNITTAGLESKFKTKYIEIAVFGNQTAPNLKEALKQKERNSAGIVSINGILGICSALKNAKRLKRTVKLSIILKTISIIVGLLIAAFMVFNNSSMTPTQILGYQSLWAMLSILAIIFGL